MTIAVDVTSLTPGSIITLFELDLTSLGGPLVRFHPGTNELNQAVVWNGNTYEPYPIMASGFEWNGQGQVPRPKLAVSNVGGLISGYILSYGDLLGATVTRRRTLLKYLDAVNFADGNPSADPTQEFPADIYVVDRKATETKESVEFELAAAIDLPGVFLPRRQIIANNCPWGYKSSECGWVPDPASGPFFDANDAPTTSANDICSKRLSGCKVRFGSTAPLPFGGFPAAALVRM